MNKYELIQSDTIQIGNKTLYRIKALKSFGNVSIGDIGGYIEKEENLSQNGNAWVYEEAKVYGGARIFGHAWVSEHAKVFGNARVAENMCIKYGQLQIDITKNQNISSSIYHQLNTLPHNNKLILYKKVNKTGIPGVFRSIYNSTIIYTVGYITKHTPSKNINKFESCGEGLHCSTPSYWSGGDTLIAVEVAVKDILSVQNEKIRCKKLKVLNEVII